MLSSQQLYLQDYLFDFANFTGSRKLRVCIISHQLQSCKDKTIIYWNFGFFLAQEDRNTDWNMVTSRIQAVSQVLINLFKVSLCYFMNDATLWIYFTVELKTEPLFGSSVTRQWRRPPSWCDHCSELCVVTKKCAATRRALRCTHKVTKIKNYHSTWWPRQANKQKQKKHKTNIPSPTELLHRHTSVAECCFLLFG